MATLRTMFSSDVKQMCMNWRRRSAKRSTVRKQWSDLPHELVLQIADVLGLIDLLSFRGVCKDWQLASSKASAQIESLDREPWFLMYGEGSQCTLLSSQYQRYTINIPEMEGATCLASNGGWLLLFREGSLFFFCPFSRATIELPNCPFSQPSDHIAAFSCAPTSPDCIVAVIRRSSELELELQVLRRGDNQWIQHKKHCPTSELGKIKSADFHEGAFQILDGVDGLVTFSAKNNGWKTYTIVPSIPRNSHFESLNYRICKDHFSWNNMKNKLGLENNIVSMFTCGTLVASADNSDDRIIQGEFIEASGEGCETRHLRGVWIQPRYFHVSSDQSW